MSWIVRFRFFSLFLTAFCILGVLTFEIFHKGYFIDENVNTQAAVQFLTKLRYGSQEVQGEFAQGISTGWASTLPSGLGWLASGNLLGSRIATTLFVLLLASLVFYFARRRMKDGLVFLIVCFSFFLKTPYATGFIYNLGEVPAALTLALSFTLMTRRPLLASFLMGLSVWSMKFIFFPVAVLGLLVLIIQHWKLKKEVSGLGPPRFGSPHYLLSFLLPLILWGTLIQFSGVEGGALKWFQGFFTFLKGGSGGASGMGEVHTSIPLMERFTNPTLEWMHYDLGWKLKIIFLTFGTIGAGLFRRFLYSKRRLSLLEIALLVILFIYSVWYFFFHPSMWIRHLQPALILGFGLWIYWLRRFIPTVAVPIALLISVNELRKSWPPFMDDSYPSRCAGSLLFQGQCGTITAPQP